ncbi:MAG TPA: hypothetical protein VF015_11260, partial [Acidimicrobiales bacterium]
MTTLEDRLRAHYADRSAREPLPGPATDEGLEEVLTAGGRTGPLAGVRATWRRRPRVLLAAVAAAVLAIAVGGAVIARDDDPGRVATDDTPAPTAPDTAPDRGPEPSTTPSTTPTTPPTSTTTVPPGSQPTGPIVSPEGVLGTWSGSAWVPWEHGATPPTGDEYRIVRLGEPITTAVGTGYTVPCSVEPVPGIDLGLEFDDDPLAPAPVGVAGVADPRPRPVEVLDPATPAYRDAAAGVVAGLGITDPAPDVSQVVRGDLDGDGSAEVVVVAERLSDPDGLRAGEGDYSVALVRRVVGGDVQ